MNIYGYSNAVWRLFQDLPGAGVLEGEAVSVQVTSNVNRAVLELQVKVEDGYVRNAKFRALGCPTTIAVGAWLATSMIDAELGQLAAFDGKCLRAELEIPEDRAHCALLGEDAIKALQAKLGVAAAANP